MKRTLSGLALALAALSPFLASAAGADAAAAGEEHSILAALETFARLEAEKKLEKTGTFSRF